MGVWAAYACAWAAYALFWKLSAAYARGCASTHVQPDVAIEYGPPTYRLRMCVGYACAWAAAHAEDCTKWICSDAHIQSTAVTPHYILCCRIGVLYLCLPSFKTVPHNAAMSLKQTSFE